MCDIRLLKEDCSLPDSAVMMHDINSEAAGCCESGPAQQILFDIIWYLMRALLGHRSALLRSGLHESLLRSNLRTQMWKRSYCEPTFPVPEVHKRKLSILKDISVTQPAPQRGDRGHLWYGAVPKCLLKVAQKVFERQLVRDLRRK